MTLSWQTMSQPSPLPLKTKLHWDTATPFGFRLSDAAFALQWQSWEDATGTCMVHKAQTIYWLTLYRRRLPNTRHIASSIPSFGFRSTRRLWFVCQWKDSAACLSDFRESIRTPGRAFWKCRFPGPIPRVCDSASLRFEQAAEVILMQVVRRQCFEKYCSSRWLWNPRETCRPFCMLL